MFFEKIKNWFGAVARAFRAKKCIKKIFPVKQHKVNIDSDGTVHTVIPCLFVTRSHYGFSSSIFVYETGDINITMKFNGNESLQQYAFSIKNGVYAKGFTPNKFSPMDLFFLKRPKLEEFLNRYRGKFRYANITVENNNLVIKCRSNTWSDSFEAAKKANDMSLVKRNTPNDVENFIMGVAMEMYGPEMTHLLDHLFDVVIM